MSGQRQLRLAALVIAALGIMRLLWLVMDSLQGGGASGWWLEAAFWGLLILTAARLLKGSDLAWFGAVVIYGCAVVTGAEAVLDVVLSSRAVEALALAQGALLLIAGGYGLWVLLVSPKVRALRAAAFHRDRLALPISAAIAVAVAAGVGWYLDRLSPEIQRVLGAQLGIAALFTVLVAWLAARNRNTPIRWEYLPLVIAGVAVVANLQAMGMLRDLRPAAAALAAKPDATWDDAARTLPGEAFQITTRLAAARGDAVTFLEAHTAGLGPWPQMEALTPGKIADSAAIDAAAAAVAEKSVGLRGAVASHDKILATFAERSRKIVASLPDTLRARVETHLDRDADALRSHYGARINLLSRAADDLGAMLTLLRGNTGRYTAGWDGAVTFQDPAATEEYRARKASLEELVVWNSRLRVEGASLETSRPVWGWIDALD